MRKTLFLSLLTVALVTTAQEQSPMVLRYNRPAEFFEESLPIGNGKLGALVYGGIHDNIIFLNDITLWTGKPTDKNLDADENPIPGTAKITCGTGTSATEYIVKDGTNGTDGYSCSATSAVGYSIISCQTGVDADENPIFKEDTVLAAGYAKCLDAENAVTGIYNTLTQQCDAGVIAPFNCGTTMIDEDVQFCENGKAYNKNDYLTAATTYPTSTYFWIPSAPEDTSVDVGEIYSKAVYGECGGDTYKLVNQYCYASGEPVTYEIKDIYELCDGKLYDTRTHFCSVTTVYEKCGGATYDPATQECDTTDPEHPSVKDKE